MFKTSTAAFQPSTSKLTRLKDYEFGLDVDNSLTVIYYKARRSGLRVLKLSKLRSNEVRKVYRCINCPAFARINKGILYVALHDSICKPVNREEFFAHQDDIKDGKFEFKSSNPPSPVSDTSPPSEVPVMPPAVPASNENNDQDVSHHQAAQVPEVQDDDEPMPLAVSPPSRHPLRDVSNLPDQTPRDNVVVGQKRPKPQTPNDNQNQRRRSDAPPANKRERREGPLKYASPTPYVKNVWRFALKVPTSPNLLRNSVIQSNLRDFTPYFAPEQGPNDNQLATEPDCDDDQLAAESDYDNPNKFTFFKSAALLALGSEEHWEAIYTYIYQCIDYHMLAPAFYEDYPAAEDIAAAQLQKITDIHPQNATMEFAALAAVLRCDIHVWDTTWTKVKHYFCINEAEIGDYLNRPVRPCLAFALQDQKVKAVTKIVPNALRDQIIHPDTALPAI